MANKTPLVLYSGSTREISSSDTLAANAFAGAGTGLTGTAASLTAGNVTTSAVIGKVLTGFLSTTGAIVAADTILQGFNKADGTVPTNWGNGSPSVIIPASSPGTTLLVSSGTSYACYLGFVSKAITVNYLRLIVRTVGSGTQVAEFGLFSSPVAPNGAAQVLTKIVATGSLGSLASLNSVNNSSSFSQAISAGTHLWGVCRTAMSVAQPTFNAMGLDALTGSFLATAATGALTGLSSFTGGLVADSANGAQCPYMMALLY